MCCVHLKSHCTIVFVSYSDPSKLCLSVTYTFRARIVHVYVYWNTPQDHCNFLPAGCSRRLKTHQSWPLYKPLNLPVETVRSDSNAMLGPQLHLTVPRNRMTWVCKFLVDVNNFFIRCCNNWNPPLSHSVFLGLSNSFTLFLLWWREMKLIMGTPSAVVPDTTWISILAGKENNYRRWKKLW